jgi:Dynamin family
MTSSHSEAHEYEAIKFELAEIVRALWEPGDAVPNPAQTLARELLARLAEDRFNLVVLGRFSRGKTTLMNALLGTDRLPTGILPVTSVITIVAYGSRERIEILPEGRISGFEIKMNELPDYVTERSNPGNSRRISMVRIELPCEILRQGFLFVDTPGLGSSIVENSLTTRSFLPQADAILMVSGYDAPLTADELRLSCSIAASSTPLFFVINKHDLVPPAERLEVEQYIRDQLSGAGVTRLPPIFSLSAMQALQAKLRHRPLELETSGVARLESTLNCFMIEEKAREFLRGMCRRITALLDVCPPSARGLGLRDRLTVISDKVTSGREAAAPRSRAAVTAGGESTRASRCVVCVRMHEALFNFLCRFQHAIASEPDARSKLAASGGLCQAHWSVYAALASDRDICLALTPLVRRVSHALEDASRERPDEHGLISAEMPPADDGGCVLCEVQELAESAAINVVLRECGHADDRSDTADIPSVCLPHLRQIRAKPGNQSAGRVLALRQAVATERLVEDMQRYALKRDGLKRGLTTEEETQAARRAIAFLAGESGPALRG